MLNNCSRNGNGATQIDDKVYQFITQTTMTTFLLSSRQVLRGMNDFTFRISITPYFSEGQVFLEWSGYDCS